MLIDRRFNLRVIFVLLLLLIFLYAVYHRGTSWKLSIDQDDFSNIVPRKDRSGFRSARPAVQHPVVDWVDHQSTYLSKGDKHRVIYSQSTKDRKYFSVDFAGADAYNVNIIPHPTYKNKWIVVAQWYGYRDDIGSSEQLICIAEFVDGVLHCPKWPTALPIALSINGKCTGEWSYANMRRGPRDARVFYGPDQPYIIYGGQSYITCLGLWVQNLWTLLDGARHPGEGFARSLTEIQRPAPWDPIEKNYFLFWDNSSQIHAHHNIYPNRTFGQLQYDGSMVSAFLATTGFNEAELSADHDNTCIKKHFPKITDAVSQGIHQGTNSLAVTMCKRSDPTCVDNDENTFILHIMQHKHFYEAQATYEPYPVLFRRRPPFELYAVAQKPLWYYGKDLLTEATGSFIYRDHSDWVMPKDHAVMTYTTSISWKDQKQTYHGYLDDILFLGFGIEDTRSAAIDVLAEDIFQDLAFC